MKSLKLKDVDFRLSCPFCKSPREMPVKDTYGGLVAHCLNNPPQGGFTANSMRARMKILDKIEGASGMLTLEDSEAKELQSAVNAMRWNTMEAQILQFLDDVKDMPDAKASK